MYTMIAQMWQKGTVTAEQIAQLVVRARLTQEQADEILAEPQA